MVKLKNKLIGKVSLFCLLVYAFVACESDSKQIKMVSAEEMETIMLSDSVQLIDVRSVEEFQEKHIKGAQSIVFDADFEDNISRLDKSLSVVVYCRTGRRSKECTQVLLDEGFTKIYELEGGIEKWEHMEYIDAPIYEE